MRYPSIDLLRTLAIVLMVVVHFGENLAGYIPPFTGLGAPLFVFLSGVSYRLWVGGQVARGRSEAEISKVSVRRGLFVFGLGFAFNILVWLPEDTFNWDVLTFIGAALLLLSLMRRIPLPISVLVAVLSVLIGPVLRAIVDYPAYWKNGYFECDLTLSDVLIGFFVTGYFPIFPWIAYSLTGFVTASLVFADESDTDPDSRRDTFRTTVLLGVGLLTTAAILIALRSRMPDAVANSLLGGWRMYPPSIEYMFATVGMALTLFGLTHRWIDRPTRELRAPAVLEVAKTFSRYSLTIYVLHHLVHLWPLWIYGVWTGHEPTHYWKTAMPATVALPLAFLFLTGCYAVFRRIGPDERHGLEAWMRWLCD